MALRPRRYSRPAMPALTLLRPSANPEAVAGGFQALELNSPEIASEVARRIKTMLWVIRPVRRMAKKTACEARGPHLLSRAFALPPGRRPGGRGDAAPPRPPA